MKSIHAISAILAICSIGSSAAEATSHAPHPARTTGPRPKTSDTSHDKSSDEGGANTEFDRVNSKQSRAGIPSLLAAGFLQGGSSTVRRN
jgi:hypothetical protein